MADPPRDLEAAYREGVPPWDVGVPQPEVVRLGSSASPTRSRPGRAPHRIAEHDLRDAFRSLFA